MKLSLRFPVAERMLAVAIALIVTYGFFYEYLPPFRRVHIFSDIEGYHYPLQRYAFDALKSGHLPQWDPSIYCGISFAGNIQAALFYPPSWLMYAVSWGQDFLRFKSLEVFAFAHIAAALALCYLWLRGRQLSILPSVFGAAVFGFGGYMVSQIVHLGVVTGLTWMPLGLWGIDEAVERRDWRPLWKTALASALSLLAGYPPSWIVFCATTFFYALASRAHWRAAVGVCAAVAASLVLSFVQLAPTLQARAGMLIEEKYGGGITRWSALLPFLVPNWFDYNRRTTAPYPDDAIYTYIGLAGVFAIGWALRRRVVRPYIQPLVPAAICLILAANPKFLPYRVITHIPFLARMLQSSNFYEGVAAMAALITGLSLQDFLSQPVKRRTARWAMPIAAVALLGGSLRQVLLWPHGGTFPVGGPAVAETALLVLLFSIALWTLRGETGRRRTWIAAVLLLAVGIDQKVHGTNRRFNTADGDPDSALSERVISRMNDTASRAILANRDYRIAIDELGAPHSTDLRKWGLATPQGFDPFLPARFRELIERWVKFRTNRLFYFDFKNEAMLQGLGVRYVIGHEGAGNDSELRRDPKFRLIGQDNAYYRVYEYQNAKPPFGWDGDSGLVHPVTWTPEQRVFKVSSDAGGRFFLVEEYYSGWRASVDGNSVSIERWKDAFQAIHVGRGPHSVVFEYHERHLELAATVSLLAVIGLTLIIVSDHQRERLA